MKLLTRLTPGQAGFKGNLVELVGFLPFLDEQATKKEEVLRKTTNFSLIHIDAYGNVERGEIANPSSCQVPRIRDFMLTMEDMTRGSWSPNEASCAQLLSR